MFADEADQNLSRDFLVAAAIFIPADRAKKLTEKVVEARNANGFNEGDPLKFSTGTKPSQITREQHTKAKNLVLEAAAQEGCKICCYIVPSSVAKGMDTEERLKAAVNTLTAKFDQFLRENSNSCGMAFFDHTTDYSQRKYLAEILNSGAPTERGAGKPHKFENIVLLDNTSVGHSHLVSVCDVVVGAFRFVANEPDKDKVGKVLQKALCKALWYSKSADGKLKIVERGLCIRPKQIKSSAIKADVNAFVTRWNNWLAKT